MNAPAIDTLATEVCKILTDRGVAFRANDVYGFVLAAQPSDDTAEEFADGWKEAQAETGGIQGPLADLDLDTSRPELSPVWDALDTPTYRVVDEEGVNVACGQLRLLAGTGSVSHLRLWLYVDDTDGYDVITDEAAKGLLVVAEEDHVPLGWDAQGNVIEM